MTSTEPRVERLEATHDLTAFACGNDDLDDWLKRHALAAQAMDTARTFVLVSRGKVIGYFSLTMGSVERRDAPAKLVRVLPQYPVGIVLLARLAVDHAARGQGQGSRLLARLAVDHAARGQGQGSRLLAHALCKALAAGEAAAARLVVVDAIDETAAAFYQRHGFIAVPEHARRLYRRTKDIRASLTRDP